MPSSEQRPPRTPTEAKPSATIVLVRDGSAGLEVFMVQRHHRIDFATGAMVFPGGKLEPGDAAPALRARCPGTDHLADEVLSYRTGAIRETFEECGVLLAGPRGSGRLVDADELRAIEARHREALDAHSLVLPELVEAEDLELACDRLVPFAHWITPVFMPKRFDTHFFLVAAPPDHIAVHDGTEGVDSVWIRPRDAVAEAETGRRTIIFPTLMNVKKLGESDSVEDVLAAARATPVVTVLPELVETDRGQMMRLPADAGYEVIEAPLDVR
jgi:8-oxo-dGTP pyrophosphatase MutT (NUDIX family)